MADDYIYTPLIDTVTSYDAVIKQFDNRHWWLITKIQVYRMPA